MTTALLADRLMNASTNFACVQGISSATMDAAIDYLKDMRKRLEDGQPLSPLDLSYMDLTIKFLERGRLMCNIAWESRYDRVHLYRDLSNEVSHLLGEKTIDEVGL